MRRDWFNEWKTENSHECKHMGKVKQLELWWQLYVTSLPERDVRNIRSLDFCWTECIRKKHPECKSLRDNLIKQDSIQPCKKRRNPQTWKPCLTRKILHLSNIFWPTGTTDRQRDRQLQLYWHVMTVLISFYITNRLFPTPMNRQGDKTGLHKSRTITFCTVMPKICGFLITVLALYHPSGALNFEVAPRFFGKLVDSCIQKILGEQIIIQCTWTICFTIGSQQY